MDPLPPMEKIGIKWSNCATGPPQMNVIQFCTATAPPRWSLLTGAIGAGRAGAGAGVAGAGAGGAGAGGSGSNGKAS